MIVAVLGEETAKVDTGNEEEVCPAGTVIAPGAWATVELLVASVMDAPPVGAGALRKTVPVALVPPTTLLGLMLTD